ncbi:polysaccharide deacetylase family protein [Dyella sp.]|jgi:peptidoglycan/xylan/chitin deacetylase (PgdA/CDA1 family)|uniref:polysaccharide deacetylase family protein n=1 Tax=Dyella sp. TaxID=1869338 RepID=UPI002D76D4BD|nr:polysaccharide deacetylase family protein [Dyella sp.]HET6432967.1 polysaccharide deacetylase family protein [Dyella sp.]
MKKDVASKWLDRTGMRQLARRMLPWSGLVALNYHRIGDAAASPYDRGLWSASAEAFSEQLRFLKREMDVISPADLPEVVKGGRGRYAMVTFDDGYRDNYEVAFPILTRESLPATFFVSTGYIDTPSLPWWDEIAWMVRTGATGPLRLDPWIEKPVAFDEPDREGAIRTLLRTYKAIASQRTEAFLEAIAAAAGTGRAPAGEGRALWMNWDMLREMKAAGMTIGGHTVTHPVLSRMTDEGQRSEIQTCAGRLAEELGEPTRCFSYPVGSLAAFDGTTRELLRKAGMDCAFSYYGGYRTFDDWDDLDIRRVAIEPEIGGCWFRSILSLPRIFA